MHEVGGKGNLVGSGCRRTSELEVQQSGYPPVGMCTAHTLTCASINPCT